MRTLLGNERKAFVQRDRVHMLHLRRQGKLWREIGQHYQVSGQRVRNYIYKPHQTQVSRNEVMLAEQEYRDRTLSMPEKIGPKRPSIDIERKMEIPIEVEQDRDQRYQLRFRRRSVTSEFFGDPLPGYSALDRSRFANAEPRAPVLSTPTRSRYDHVE